MVTYVLGTLEDPEGQGGQEVPRRQKASRRPEGEACATYGERRRLTHLTKGETEADTADERSDGSPDGTVDRECESEEKIGLTEAEWDRARRWHIIVCKH